MLLDVLRAQVFVFCFVLFAAAVPALTDTGASAVDLSGKVIDPLKDNRGKVLVLIFLRTDCPVSNRYAPTLKTLNAPLGQRAKVWLIFPARSESASSIQHYLATYGYTLPALQDRDLRLVHLAQAKITPEAAVFNGRGELVYHGRIDNWYESPGRSRAGATTHEMDDAITAALNGRKPKLANAPAIGCYISDLE